MMRATVLLAILATSPAFAEEVYEDYTYQQDESCCQDTVYTFDDDYQPYSSETPEYTYSGGEGSSAVPEPEPPKLEEPTPPKVPFDEDIVDDGQKPPYMRIHRVDDPPSFE